MSAKFTSTLMAVTTGILFTCPDASLAEEVTKDPQIAQLTETGIWRTRIQRIYDPSAHELLNRSYTIWDPYPSRHLEFSWFPAKQSEDKSGNITGVGKVVWRQEGAASYDRTAVRAEFQGTIIEGMLEGYGVYHETSGLYYEGEWMKGLMHGRGVLTLPSGEVYRGEFRNGKADGTGKFIDNTGEVFEGSFSEGQRSASGMTTLPNGVRYESHWIAGQEADDSKAIRLAQFFGQGGAGQSDVRIGITVDRHLPRVADAEYRRGDLWYTVDNSETGLSIFPNNPRLMSMWKGGGEIQLTQDEDGRPEYYPDNFGIFSKTKGELIPLNLLFRIENRSSSATDIVGAYIDVEQSFVDFKPAIQLSVGRIAECTLENHFLPRLRFQNFGWSSAENAEIKFSFVAPNSVNYPQHAAYTRTIGKIDKELKVDLENEVRANKVNIGRAKAGSLQVCAQLSSDCILPFNRSASQAQSCSKSSSMCLSEVISSGVFGQLSDRIALQYEYIVTGVAGTLTYDWRDAKRVTHRETSRFKVLVPIGLVPANGECGEGAGPEVIASKPQYFRLDASSYRIPLSFRTSLRAGATTQLKLPVAAEKSSQHNFTVVLQLANGKEIRSRPVNLLYYRPSWSFESN